MGCLFPLGRNGCVGCAGCALPLLVAALCLAISLGVSLLHHHPQAQALQMPLPQSLAAAAPLSGFAT